MAIQPVLQGEELLYWNEQAKTQKHSSVDNQRKVADNWAKGLAGLTSLVALATVVKGAQTFTEVSKSGQRYLLGFAAAGFLALLAGSLSAMSAAYGKALDDPFYSGLDLWKWAMREERRIGVTLRLARGLFVVGLVLVASAVGTTWVAKAKPPATSSFVLTLTHGSPVCGTVDGSQLSLDNYFIAVQPTTGEPRTEHVPREWVKSISIVDRCPR